MEQMMIYTSNLIGVKQSVVDEFLLLNATQIPLLTLLGGFGQEITNVTHEWNEDTMFKVESVSTAQINTTDTTLPVADAEAFRAGSIIRMGEEMMEVTAVVGLNLTIVRSFAGTTPATHLSGAVVESIFTKGVEGAVARAARFKERVNVSNYTQIFDDSVEITGTAAAIDSWGIDNLIEQEKQKKISELALALEKAIIGGVKYRGGTTSTLKGIRSFITTNVINANNAELSHKLLNDLVESVFTHQGSVAAGGNYCFMVGTTQKRKISQLDAGKLIVPRQDRVTGRNVDVVMTDLGEFPVYINPNLAVGEITFLDKNRMKVLPLKGRNWFFTYMGAVGDLIKGQLVGEFTFDFKQQEAHARMHSLKSTW
jgi:hypothetical protein